MKIKQKLTAMLLTTILLGSNLLPICSKVIAVDSIDRQNSKTNHANIEFDSYLSGNVHEQTYIATEGGKVYLKLNVKENGYLKNGIVEFEDANYEINSNQIKNEYVQKIENKKMYLNQISYGKNVEIEVPISMQKQEQIESENFNKESKIKFEGTYIDGSGKEKTIEKQIINQIKWKDEPQIELSGEITKYLPYQIGEEYGVIVQSKINSSLAQSKLPIKTTNLEITLPTINEQKPERVTVIANSCVATTGIENGNNFTNENYTYNKENGILNIQNQNNPNQQGKISWKEGKDEYIVTYVYIGEQIHNTVKEQLQKASKTKKELEKQQNNNAQTQKTNEQQTKIENPNAIKGQIPVKAIINVYSAEEKTVEKQGILPYNIEEQTGKLEDIDLITTNKISKGYIYTNYAKDENAQQSNNEEQEQKQETIYELIYRMQIYDTKLSGEIQFQTNSEKLIANKEQLVGNNIITKQIKINKNIFNKILGEQGKIEIYSKEGTLLETITKQTSKDQEENFSINISEKNINEIYVKASKPITEGTLEIKIEKAFNTNLTYSQTQMKTFSKMTVGVIAKSNNNMAKELKKQIELVEPISKAQISMAEGKQTLSTVVENKDVNMNIVLDTSNMQNALYKDPVLEIEMPQEITDVKVKECNLVLDDELKIKETNVISKEGKKIIQIQLEGTQTKYYSDESSQKENIIAKGANILLKTDITVNKLAASKTQDIKMRYTNQNISSYENDENIESKEIPKYGTAIAKVEITAPAGVATATIMKGFKGEEILENLSQETKEAVVAIYEAKKQVQVQNVVTNNYDNTIENVAILGRLPFSSNKQVDTANDLGSNFDMPLTGNITIGGIEQSKVKIYYSSNANATKDLNNSENGWQETPSNLSNIKSYLVVVQGAVEKSTQLIINYVLELPQNLSYNKNSYLSYKVYYDNKSKEVTTGETKVAGIVGVTTGNGPEIEIKLSSTIKKDEQGNNILPNKGVIKYTAQIENKGKVEATSAKLVVDTPKYTDVVKLDDFNTEYEKASKEIQIGTIKAGDKKQVSYYLMANTGEKQNEQETLKTQVALLANNINGSIKSNEENFKLVTGRFGIINRTNTEENEYYTSVDEITYEVRLIRNDGKSNVTVTVPLPQNANVLEAYWKENKSKEGIEIQTGKVIAKGQISGSTKDLIVKFKLKDNTKQQFSTQVFATAQDINGTKSEDYYVSNENYIFVDQPQMTGKQLQPEQTYVKEGALFDYNFTIDTSQKGSHTNLVLEDILPEELEFVNARVEMENNIYYSQEDVKQEGNKIIIKIPKVSYNCTVKIKIQVRGMLKSGSKDEKEIINKATIYSDQVQKQELSSVKQYLQYNEGAHNNPITGNQVTPGNNGGNNGGNNSGNNNNNNSSKKYKISGTAWLDENQDGKRDETEELLSGIKTMLVYKSNGNVVKDEKTGKDKIVTTNKKGQYEFTNIPSGKYLVIFLYDASSYSITKYQAEDVGEGYNSDAISMQIMLDGEKQYAGVTDTIKVQGSNCRDIDIGLYQEEKFDLRLDKYISKMSLTTPTIGTKTYNYKNSKLEKVEILGKNINKSSVVVEYKIKVTNEGKVPGYVKKIVDYLPQDVKFSTNINKDWYLSDNNKNVYNTSLENTLINPGESKEVSLVLSFNITDKNMGQLVSNSAEIYESYNEQGIQDFDSKESNKVETEDDMSTANLVISIVTGKIVLYVTLAIAVIILLGIGTFEIKKRVMSK